MWGFYSYSMHPSNNNRFAHWFNLFAWLYPRHIHRTRGYWIMTDAHGYYRIETFYAYGHKQKVRTKEKMEVRDRVDNNHINLKNRQIARIRLGKKVYNAQSLLKLVILSFITALYFSTTTLYLTVLRKTWISRLPLFVLAWNIWYFARRINRSYMLSVCT